MHESNVTLMVFVGRKFLADFSTCNEGTSWWVYEPKWTERTFRSTQPFLLVDAVFENLSAHCNPSDFRMEIHPEARALMAELGWRWQCARDLVRGELACDFQLVHNFDEQFEELVRKMRQLLCLCHARVTCSTQPPEERIWQREANDLIRLLGLSCHWGEQVSTWKCASRTEKDLPIGPFVVLEDARIDLVKNFTYVEEAWLQIPPHERTRENLLHRAVKIAAE